jgi:hypothetical protein
MSRFKNQIQAIINSKLAALEKAVQEIDEDVLLYVEQLTKDLAQLTGGRVQAIATYFPSMEFIEFHILADMSESDCDKIHEIVIDAEWKLRDNKNKNFYFSYGKVNDFSSDSFVIFEENGRLDQ